LDSKTVVDGVGFDEVGDVEVVVRVRARDRWRCPECKRKCGVYDRGSGGRRWRSLDCGVMRCWLVSSVPRVSCPKHGVVVAWTPWARRGAGHTRVFDQQVAWLATKVSKTAAAELMRVKWETVGVIVARVWADVEAEVDLLDGLKRIGIDEVSYRKGQKYVMVVVDHDTGRVVWMGEGRSTKTLNGFFDKLGQRRCEQIELVSADGADFIARVVADRCPKAELCADPFHVVKWATDALDEVRKGTWRRAQAEVKVLAAQARGQRPPSKSPVTKRGRPRGAKNKTEEHKAAAERARALRSARWPLLKNPENLTEKQQAKLRLLESIDPVLYRAYGLKEALRYVFHAPTYDEATDALKGFLSWASRSKIPEFVALGRTIRAHLKEILNTLRNGMSNGRIESVNAKLRLITRVAFGFRRVDAMIGLAMLSLGGHSPTLPGRI
jgi:transposase